MLLAYSVRQRRVQGVSSSSQEASNGLSAVGEGFPLPPKTRRREDRSIFSVIVSAGTLRNAPKNKQQQQQKPLRGCDPLARARGTLSSALRLCRPPTAPFGKGTHPLHLLPLAGVGRAKACLRRDTARSFRNGRLFRFSKLLDVLSTGHHRCAIGHAGANPRLPKATRPCEGRAVIFR